MALQLGPRLKRDGSHHALCPVKALRVYLDITSNFNSSKIFVNPVSGLACDKGRISYFFLSSGFFPIRDKMRGFRQGESLVCHEFWESEYSSLLTFYFLYLCANFLLSVFDLTTSIPGKICGSIPA